MRLSEIISAVIRLLALKLGLDSFDLLMGTLARFRVSSPHYSDFLIFPVLAVMTYWFWKLSPVIARRVTKGQDSTLETCNSSLFDLYSFAFLIVGLYFALDSLPPSITWFHYAFSQSSSEGSLSPQQQGNFYTLFKYLAKCILGFAFIFNGRKFASRLIKYQTNNCEQSHGADGDNADL